jgi:hypothetical protein
MANKPLISSAQSSADSWARGSNSRILWSALHRPARTGRALPAKNTAAYPAVTVGHTCASLARCLSLKARFGCWSWCRGTDTHRDAPHTSQCASVAPIYNCRPVADGHDSSKVRQFTAFTLPLCLRGQQQATKKKESICSAHQFRIYPSTSFALAASSLCYFSAVVHKPSLTPD